MFDVWILHALTKKKPSLYLRILGETERSRGFSEGVCNWRREMGDVRKCHTTILMIEFKKTVAK